MTRPHRKTLTFPTPYFPHDTTHHPYRTNAPHSSYVCTSTQVVHLAAPPAPCAPCSSPDTLAQYIRSAHEAFPRGQFSPTVCAPPPGTHHGHLTHGHVCVSRGSDVNVAVCSQQISVEVCARLFCDSEGPQARLAAPRLGEHGAGEAWIRCRLGGHGEILRARLGGEAVVGCGSAGKG